MSEQQAFFLSQSILGFNEYQWKYKNNNSANNGRVKNNNDDDDDDYIMRRNA